jgi:hypothetical protein
MDTHFEREFWVKSKRMNRKEGFLLLFFANLAANVGPEFLDHVR